MTLVEELRGVVGPQHVLVDADVRAGYETDWTGRFVGSTPCVVRPGSTDEVAAVVRACAVAGATIVPQGGNTGLVGGGVPLAGEVVLSLRRLSSVGPVDRLASQVTVGAGAVLAVVQDAARAAGLAFAVDLSARDSATIGGMIATNAGGLHHIRWGSMRANVVGVEAVLADGSIVSRLSGLTKDNTGYDLTSLLCGSEGTLGIVCAARLRLVRAPGDVVTAVVECASVEDAVATVAAMRDAVVLDAAEVWLDLPSPFPSSPVALLLEWEGPVDALAAAVADRQAVVADDSARRRELWAFRESITEAINAVGPPPHKLDVTLPVASIAPFCSEVGGVVGSHRLFLFGHVGDGNIHVNVVGPAPDDLRVDEAVLELVASFGGSISAEHGIGTAKKPWLHLSRSDAELAAMRAIKQALDPKGLLNPNVLVGPA